MANGNTKGLTTGETVAATLGAAALGAVAAGLVAWASKGSGKKTTQTAGPRLKTKGCGGCGR